MPEMAAPPLADIHPPGLPPMGFPDGPPQAVFRSRDGTHMDVGGHQPVRPHFPRARSTPRPHQRDIVLIVLGAEARLLPPVPRGVMWWGIPGATTRASRTLSKASSSVYSKSRSKYGVPGIFECQGSRRRRSHHPQHPIGQEQVKTETARCLRASTQGLW